MTRDTDFIEFLEEYLDEHEGRTPLPDETRDAIRAHLPSTHQRPAWWPGWRFPQMNSTTKLALGVAAAAVVAVVGFAALTGGTNVGSPDPSGADPTVAASVAATRGALPAYGDDLAAGQYYIDVRLHTYTAEGLARRVEPDYRLSFDLPAGWSGSGFSVTKDGSFSTGLIAGAAHALYDAPCESSKGTSSLANLPTSGGVPDYAAAMASLWNRGTDPATTVPVPGTLAGRDARYIELTAPSDLDFATCDGGKYLLFVDPGQGQRWLQEPGQLDRIWVVDLEPGVMFLDVALEPGGTAAERAELDAIVASMRIEPVEAP